MLCNFFLIYMDYSHVKLTVNHRLAKIRASRDKPPVLVQAEISFLTIAHAGSNQ